MAFATELKCVLSPVAEPPPIAVPVAVPVTVAPLFVYGITHCCAALQTGGRIVVGGAATMFLLKKTRFPVDDCRSVDNSGLHAPSATTASSTTVENAVTLRRVLFTGSLLFARIADNRQNVEAR